MQNNRTLICTLAIALAAVASACSQESPKAAMPEVNDENCKRANVDKIEDEAIKGRFMELCFTRNRN